MFRLTNFVVVISITVLINIIITIISWQKKTSKGGLYFALAMLALTFWTISIALDYAAIPLGMKIFFAKCESTGYNIALALFAMFAISFWGHDDWLEKTWARTIFWVIPLSNILMAWTNEFHHWLWKDFSISPLGPNFVVFHHGPGFLWTSTTGYIFIVIMLFSLWQTARNGTVINRRQARILFGALLIPIISNIFYQLNGKTSTGIDWTPVTFSISSLFFLFAIYGSRFLNIVPVARDIIIERMSDTVLVMDAYNHIVDFNQIAQEQLHFEKNPLGKTIQQLLPHWPELIKFSSSHDETNLNMVIKSTSEATIFDARKTILKDNNQNIFGILIILREITKRYEIEQALNERVKELNCIYDLTQLVDQPDISLEDILQESTHLLAQAMSYPEHACGKLVFEKNSFTTENYQDTDTNLRQEISIGGEVSGYLEVGYLHNETDHEFQNEEINLLYIISEKLSEIILMHRAQEDLSHQQQELAKLEERKRMARDLHDSVSQSIHSMVLFSETLSATLEKKNFERAQHISRRIAESAKQSHKETRLLLYELLDEGPEKEVDLIKDLDERLTRVERHTGVQAEITHQGNLEHCPQSMQKDLFWIANEALNNAIKHAQAQKILIKFRCLSNSFRMEISDDGKGFDPLKTREGGLGLANMQTRAAELGGILKIKSRPRAGTSVIFQKEDESRKK